MDSDFKKAVLLTAMISSFTTPFLGGAINIALPAIGTEFHMNSVALSWVASVFLLSTVICLVPVGRWADIVGRKKIYFYGSLILIAGNLLILWSPNTLIFFAARAIQGIGSAMIFSTSTAILTSVFPPQERGKALGLNVTSVYLGGSLGPALGGILVHSFGWRSIFIFNLLIVFLIPVMIQWKIKNEWKDSHGEKYDWKGTWIYASFIFCLMYGLSMLPEESGWILLLAGIALFVLFVTVEKRESAPLFEIKLFQHNTVFAFSNLAAFINYSATFGVGILLSLYLQFIQGLSAQTAGLVLLAQPLMMAMVSPFSGRKSDSLEPRILTSTGMGLSVIGLLGLTLLTPQTSVLLIMAYLVLLGVGFGLFSSPNMNAIMTSVEKKHLGIASSTAGVMRLTGQMLSMGIVMTFFSWKIGRVKITSEYYPHFLASAKIIFALFALLCTLGVWASLKRGNLHTPKKE
jgi:MFS family permease